jgi:hypothetical protein
LAVPRLGDEHVVGLDVAVNDDVGPAMEVLERAHEVVGDAARVRLVDADVARRIGAGEARLGDGALAQNAEHGLERAELAILEQDDRLAVGGAKRAEKLDDAGMTAASKRGNLARRALVVAAVTVGHGLLQRDGEPAIDGAHVGAVDDAGGTLAGDAQQLKVANVVACVRPRVGGISTIAAFGVDERMNIVELGRLAPLRRTAAASTRRQRISSSVPLLGNANALELLLLLEFLLFVTTLGVGDGAGVLGRIDLISMGSPIVATLDERRIGLRLTKLLLGAEACRVGASSGGEGEEGSELGLGLGLDLSLS